MKISESGNSITELISQYKINEEKVSSEPEKQAANSVVQEEKVTLSSAARDIQQAEKAVEKLPDVREEKVRELQNQIETGRYDVNGEKIAGKMISESLLDIMV
ncbi:MAG: flagellar biosynthesis anti-sigma factor FlgM [Proteobacteria bacterium]|jgi:negative regulator of flagellin synthesis FlgM|nr:flagellar biosynthesis anti-sigma factor FlgM [Pseudomonadota bacterium]